MYIYRNFLIIQQVENIESFNFIIKTVDITSVYFSFIGVLVYFCLLIHIILTQF